MYEILAKVALITGGTGGIGLALAKELLKNGSSGITLVDLKPSAQVEKLQDEFGHHLLLFVKADVTDKKQLEDAFEATIARFKQLDIVINNAGVLDELNWELTINVNLTALVQGTYLAMQKYLPLYKSASAKEGVVVNISSLAGVIHVIPCAVYSATKAAVVSLGKTLGSQEYYNKYRVRVLTILPGRTDTPIYDDATDKLLMPEYFVPFVDLFANQSPDFLGRAVVNVIKSGQNGTLWVSEEEKLPYEIDLPTKEEMIK